DHQACPRPGRGGSAVVGPECTERTRADRTLLGAAQERWLAGALAESKSRWNLIVQQTLLVPAGRPASSGMLHWTDGWDGYPAARERLLEALAKSGATNPVVLGGDVHTNYVADVHARPGDPESPVVAAEFCGTSITSQGGGRKLVESIREANPHIRFADGSKRGYILLDLGRERLEARLRVLDAVTRRDAEISTAAAFTVLAGRPGIAP
ncbi:MAG: alkaline phosphatase, partial [Betaproteobacteria bacterium]